MPDPWSPVPSPYPPFAPAPIDFPPARIKHSNGREQARTAS